MEYGTSFAYREDDCKMKKAKLLKSSDAKLRI